MDRLKAGPYQFNTKHIKYILCDDTRYRWKDPYCEVFIGRRGNRILFREGYVGYAEVYKYFKND